MHTPGPWTIGRIGQSDEPLEPQVSADMELLLGEMLKLLNRLGDAREAGSLIAAAPDLLDALQLAFARISIFDNQYGGNFDSYDVDLDVIRRAIAKATATE